MRKYYGRKFCAQGFSLGKDDSTKFMSDVREYIATEFGSEMQKLHFKHEDLAQTFGALVHPKLAFRHYENEPLAKGRVQVVYNYLYKFSFERLQELLSDPVMLMFFVHMLDERCS